jgi:hypothetical protein
MDWSKLLDWLAVGFSVMLFVPGLGSQAYYNWKRGTTRGLHPVLVHLFPVSVGLWALWGIVRGLWPPIATNAFGLLFSTIILVQYYVLPREERR